MLCVLIVAKQMEVTILMTRTFNELKRLPSFVERYEYLRLDGLVGESTFGFDRYLNQLMYRSKRWRDLRDDIIIRDNACDLAMPDYEIRGRIIIHHMNPITIEDIERNSDEIYDPQTLICVSNATHLAIHYGDKDQLPELPVERRPGDTVPWRLKS